MFQSHSKPAVLVLAALSLASLAQAQWMPCRHFGVREGLAQSQVTDLTQDANGYLWIATQGGVSRFDGIRFTLYTTAQGLPDNVVTSIAVRKDAMWVGTDLGLLAVWGGTTFTPLDGPVPGRRIPIRSIAIRQAGGLLVATEEGLFEGEPGSFKRILGESIGRLRTLDDGSIWALGRHVYRIPKTGSPERLGFPKLPGRAVGVVHDGATTWIAWDTGGLVRQTPAGLRIEHPRLKGKVTDLALDPQGGLLIGTDHGVWRRKPGGELLKIPLTLQPQRIHVRRLFVDRESNLWVGTFGEGLIQRPPSPFTQFSLETGLPASIVWSFSEDPRGCIWMGTGGAGVVSWCRDHWGPVIDARNGLPSEAVLTLGKDDAGRLWIGTREGLCRYDKGRCSVWTSRNGLPSDDIRGIAADGHGGVWVATAGGLAHWNGTAWKSYTNPAGLRAPLLRSVVVDARGTVWASVHGNGIISFDGHRFTHLGLDAGLPTLRIWSLMAGPGGGIWACTDEGIWIRSPDGATSRVVVEGLPSPIVVFLVRDEEGFVWAGTTRGVARLAPDGKVVQRCTAEDGLTDSEAAEGAAFLDSLGQLWLGMAYGVTRVDTRLLLRNTVPPVVVLERFQVDGSTPAGFRPVSSTTSENGPVWTLGPGPVDLRFDFSAPSLLAPSEVRYRYFLEGFDPAPTEPVAETHATYHRVPAGRYRFILEASNNDGVWSEKPLELRLVVLPPWYASLWFRALGALLVAGLVFLAIRVRCDAQERRRRALEEEVRQRTAELAEANHRIQEQNRLLKELSRTDPLTGLGNRRVLAEHLPMELAVLRREIVRKGPPTLAAYHGAMLSIIDLDHFKRVNDRWGHELGDRALRAVADTLSPVLREGDTAVRWGGEEFVILSRGVDTPGAIRVARRLLEYLGAASIEAPDGTAIRLVGSVGFLQLPLGTGTFVERTLWASFVDAADRLLYEAKARGRFRACGAVWRYGATGPVPEREVLPELLERPSAPPAPLRFIEILPEEGSNGENQSG